jgi:replicative DNA helicase
MNHIVRITKTLKDKGLMIREGEITDLIDTTSSFYQSLYYYGEDVITYFRANKSSIRGFKGKVTTPYIIFDIDSKDLEVSKQNTILLIDWLKDQGMYDEYAAKIAFSGSKGFHLTLQTAYEFTPKELKSICMYISSQVSFIEEAGFLRVDPSIYNINRQFRIVNTINEKSKLYKIEMVESELRNCTMDTIKEAASKPQKVYPFESTIDDKPIRAILLQLAEYEKDRYEAPKVGVIKTLMGASIKRKHCIEIIQDGDMKDGESNSGLLRLASHYRRLGYTQEQCRDKLVEAGINRTNKYPLTNRFDDDKLDNEILYPVYSTEGYIFTCEDWFLKMKCEGACNYVPSTSSEFIKRPVDAFVQAKPTTTKTEVIEPVKRPVVNGFFEPVKSFKSSMVKQSAGDVMKLNGFRTVKQSSESFKEFADDWVKHRVITGIDAIDDVVRILPTGLVLINARPGAGKCHGIDTPIMMFDGSIKKVQDIIVGDLLMGPDSKSREVLSLARGKEEMFRVNPIKGDSWTCNRSHMLSLKWSTKNYSKKFKNEEVHNISVNDFLDLNKTQRGRFKQYRTSLDFDSKEVVYDPYLVGAWLAEGSKDTTVMHCGDIELLNEVEKVVPEGLFFRNHGFTRGCYRFSMSNTKGKPNHFLNFLRKACMVNGEKRVPVDYLVNDRASRLKILAGLLDGDGYVKNNIFEITTKYVGLKNDIKYLAETLGFQVTTRVKKVQLKTWTEPRVYQKISISGDTSEIPTKVPGKQASVRSQIKNPLHTGFSLESLGEGDYYGFTLSGDHLYCLGDTTVTHNTTIALNIMQNCAREGKNVLFYSIDMTEDEFFTKSKSKALKISPDDVMDLYFSKDEEALALQSEGDNLTEEMLRNVYINYDAKINPDKIDADITSFKEAGITIHLVMVDFLQKMEGCGDFTSPRIGTNLMGLKALQPKHKVCIIGLSQMPRSGGSEETPVLTAAAAKGGGVYEENASVVINLWRPMKFYRNDEGSQDKYLGVMVAKNRMGECKQIVLKFNGAISEIRSLTVEEQEEYEITVEERKQREQKVVSRGFGNV